MHPSVFTLILAPRGPTTHRQSDIVQFQCLFCPHTPIAAIVDSFSSAGRHPPNLTAATVPRFRVRYTTLPPLCRYCLVHSSVLRRPSTLPPTFIFVSSTLRPPPPTHSCKMLLRCVGGLITERDPRFICVRKSHSEKR